MLAFVLVAFIALLLVGWFKRLALQGQLQKVRGEYAKLREDHSAVSAAHATLQQSYQDMRRIAADAIQLAHKRHFSSEQVSHDETAADVENRIRSMARSQSNYTPPEVKFCVCNVSVRSDVWPIACPSCGKFIGDDSILDADVLE